MLAIPNNTRIFISHHPVSMRKSFEGLSALVEEIFSGELFSGALFVFFNRQKDHIKILVWDGDGFAIHYKRLEKGHFRLNLNNPEMIDRRSFLMILEGIIPKKLDRRYAR